MLGFSTGVFHSLSENYINRFSSECWSHYLKLPVIEIQYSSEESGNYLLSKKIDVSSFQFVSLHTPGEGGLDISKVELLAKKYQAHNIVVHPNQDVDWKLLASCNLPCSIENMGAGVWSGIEEVKKIIDRYHLKLTLDLQHCFRVDPTMKLAQEFQEVFQDELVEYHLSGLGEDGAHEPLFKTKQTEIVKAILYPDKPIIIESSFSLFKEVQQELDFLSNLGLY